MCIAEACLEIGFSLTALIGWCGRLSAHDSSFFFFFLYMEPLWGSELSWWWLAHTAIDTLIQLHDPEILVHITCMYYFTLDSFHWTSFGFRRICCVSCQECTDPLLLFCSSWYRPLITLNTAAANISRDCSVLTRMQLVPFHFSHSYKCLIELQVNTGVATLQHPLPWILLSEKIVSVCFLLFPVLPWYTLTAAEADVIALLCPIELSLRARQVLQREHCCEAGLSWP